MLFDNLLGTESKIDTMTTQFMTSDGQENRDVINLYQDLDNAQQIYVSSDLHLYDNYDRTKILLYKHVKILSNPNTIWICCGDLLSSERSIDINKLKKDLSMIKSIKILILGNNDTLPVDTYKNIGFKYILKRLIWKKYIFTHDVVDMRNIPDFYINIHGHLHGMAPTYAKNINLKNRFDVYPDLNEFEPYLLTNINSYIVARNEKMNIIGTSTESNNIDKPFAVFALYYDATTGMVAATTRANDRGEGGRIGLPGGKVDPDENPIDALRRESKEEGWDIDDAEIDEDPIHTAYVDNNLIFWYSVSKATMLNDYKEKYRGIKPIYVTVDQISKSGYGNEFIKDYIKERYSMENPDYSNVTNIVRGVNELFDIIGETNKITARDLMMEAPLTHRKRSQLPDKAFGLPKLRKYPLYDKDGNPDKNHIRAAMAMFHHCPEEYKPELARNILKAAKKAKIPINENSEWYKYATRSKTTHESDNITENESWILPLLGHTIKNNVYFFYQKIRRYFGLKHEFTREKIREFEENRLVDIINSANSKEDLKALIAQLEKWVNASDELSKIVESTNDTDNIKNNNIFVVANATLLNKAALRIARDKLKRIENGEKYEKIKSLNINSTTTESDDSIIDDIYGTIQDVVYVISTLYPNEKKYLGDRNLFNKSIVRVVKKIRMIPIAFCEIYQPENKPIGFVNLAVSPEYRSKGYARDVFYSAIDLAFEHGITTIYYIVHEDNINSQLFAAKHGLILQDRDPINNKLRYVMYLTGKKKNVTKESFNMKNTRSISFEKDLDDKLNELKDRKNGISNDTETLSEGPNPTEKDDSKDSNDDTGGNDSGGGDDNLNLNFGDDDNDDLNLGDNSGSGDDNSGDNNDFGGDSGSSSSTNAQPPNKLILFREYSKILNILDKTIKNIETNQYIVSIDNVTTYIATLKSIRNDIQYIMDKCFLTMDYSELLVQFTTIQKRISITTELLKRYIKQEENK